jgi:hypothetical protein
MIAEHVDDHIAAYAFGALSEEERRDVLGHAASCPACAARLEEAETLTSLLPYSVPLHRAPADIKRTLFQELAATVPAAPAVYPVALDRGGDGASGERAAEPPPWARPGGEPRWSRLLFRTVPWTVAVLGWLVAAAFIIYSHGQSDRLATQRQDYQARIDALNRQLSTTQQQLAAAEIIQGYLPTPGLRVVPLKYMAGVARHTTLNLLMAPHIAHAVIVARGLAILPAGKTYAVWARAGKGLYVHLGDLTTGGPRAEGVSLVLGPQAIDTYRTAGVTIESQPVPDQPSTPLVFAATLEANASTPS